MALSIPNNHPPLLPLRTAPRTVARLRLQIQPLVGIPLAYPRRQTRRSRLPRVLRRCLRTFVGSLCFGGLTALYLISAWLYLSTTTP